MQLPYSNMRIAHQNPGAEMPLVLPLHVICNTSDEEIYANIRVNSRRPGKWQQLIEAHEDVAILCGSGPSLADSLVAVRALQEAGGKVFAMNGAAAYLAAQGIYPDYQVIVDAREETAQLVGPARHHLFASQVHPACFGKALGAIVWHLQVGGIEDHFPEYGNDYCLIGGAASVGNCATCLAYSMGYRNLQVFGYDSSYKGDDSHAFHQAMNLGEPCASVRFGDKDYICSLTMKLQAEKFQETARALESYGCAIAVHGEGLLPDMWRAPQEQLAEHEKYERMWQFQDYRQVAPGELVAEQFVTLAGIKPSDVVIDFGCGTGRGAKRVHELTGCSFILVDFTENSLDTAVLDDTSWYTRLRHDLSEPFTALTGGGHGFCTDVLEHIPPEQVDAVITNVMGAARRVFFQISLVDDQCGVLIGHPLHLSVHDADWWFSAFRRLGYAVDYVASNDSNAVFYVTNPNTLTT